MLHVKPAPIKKQFKEQSSGFTLVEIVLVVLLLSVVAGLTIPNFRNTFSKVKLQNSVDTVAYVMRYAQSRAITKGGEMRLEIDKETREYWLTEKNESSSEVEDNMFRRFKHRMGRKFSLASDLMFESEAESVLFFPDGSIEKKQVKICQETNCYVVSTREQRGSVNVFKVEN